MINVRNIFDTQNRELRRDTRYYARRMRRKLEQLNICYRFPKSSKDFLDRGIQRVKFEIAVANSEAIYYVIDPILPRGISFADIDDETVLKDLSIACERRVAFKRYRDMAMLVVERETGVFQIRKLDFPEMMDNYPQESRKELVVPLGLGHNRKLVYRSLDEFPHALVGGATKSGKTTFLHAWISTLSLKYKPEMLKFVLIDLKGGVEFTRYKKLPHLLTIERDGEEISGFIKDRDNVVQALRWLRWEMDRRLDMFEQAGGIQNVAAWNYRHRAKPMCRIAVVIDELASIMLEPDLKKNAERLLADIGARGRAPGIHLVVATQRPEVSVVSGRIKGNIDARFAFRVPDNASSMVILDDTSAAQFPPNTPRGRFIFKFGNERREIQGPLVKPSQIKTIVDSIVSGDEELQQESSNMDPEAVFRVALTQLDGACSINKMYKILRGKASHYYLTNLFKDYEGEIIEIDEELYELQPSPGAFESRHIVPLANEHVSNSRNRG
jgi:DNA segregation ATPase FtsK/SpoIIIE-like protein